MAGFNSADPAAQQSLPANRSARRGGLRLLPQGRRYEPIPDDVNAVLFLPLDGLRCDHEPEPRDGQVLHHLRDLPQHGQLAERKI